eukprot:6241043-Prymnesium_polylepis.2
MCTCTNETDAFDWASRAEQMVSKSASMQSSNWSTVCRRSAGVRHIACGCRPVEYSSFEESEEDAADADGATEQLQRVERLAEDELRAKRRTEAGRGRPRARKTGRAAGGAGWGAPSPLSRRGR